MTDQGNVAAGRTIANGFLIALEGIDGAGKSTIAARVGEALRSQGWLVTLTREPGGTSFGTSLRQILKGAGVPIDPWAEAFLFEADRAQTYAEVLAPALQAGGIVISDRGPFGTIAYQGHGRGLDLGLIDQMNAVAWRHLADLVIVVDVSPELGLERKRSGAAQDRFEGAGIAFLERARNGYLSAARLRGPDAVVVDGHRPADQVFADVIARVEERLSAATAQPGRDLRE
jgi:dTMP kinase